MEGDILFSLQDKNFTLIIDDTTESVKTLLENVSTNNTLVNYKAYMGPKRKALIFVVPMTLVYVSILATGIVGNICTCVVIAKNKHMQTATNYYLFSLAISDLLLLVLGLPQEMYQLWENYPYIFGEFFCFFRGLTSETSTNASILTITAFTVERYLAICHPLRAHTMSKLSRAVKFVIIIWFLGALAAVAIAFQFGIVVLFDITDYAVCTVKRPLKHAFGISTLFFFIIPMSIILILYVLIALQLRRSLELSYNETTHETNNGSSPQSTHSKYYRQTTTSSTSNSSRRAVIKMLVAVVVAFFVCYAPFHAQRLMATYVTNPTPTETIIYDVLMYMSGVLYYVSATINPILYSIMSLKFRQAFKETLAKCCGRQISRSQNFAIMPRYTTRHSTAFETTDLTVLSETSHPYQRTASPVSQYYPMSQNIRGNPSARQQVREMRLANIFNPRTCTEVENSFSLHGAGGGSFIESKYVLQSLPEDK